MIVECGHCGAPLDVREGISVTTCRYCGKANQRQQMRTISTQTPPNFRPPPQWTPPAHFPAPSNVTLKYHSNRVTVIVTMVVVISMVGGVAAAIFGVAMTRRVTMSPGGKSIPILSSGTTPQMLASVNLNQGPDGIANALGARPSKTSVYVTLNDPRYEYVTLSWDEKNLEHPTGFYLAARNGVKADQKMQKSLEKWLHGGLTGTSWNWFGGSGMHLNDDSATIGGNVQLSIRGRGQDTANPRWKEKFVALWKVALEAAFGLPASIPQADTYELLGAGHPLSKLASIDPNTTVETAPATLQKMFPGSSVSTFIGLDVDVSIEHPLFKHADMAWKNEKNGPLRSVHFRTKASWTARREAFVECIGGKLGKPEVREADYVNKKRDYEFRSHQVRLLIPENMAYIVGYRDNILGPDFVKIIGAVSECQ